MQTISSLIPKGRNGFQAIAAKSETKQQLSTVSGTRKDEIAQAFNEIFSKVLACCSGWRAAITSSGQMAATKQVWLDAFTRHADKLSPEAISTGLLRLEAARLKWLPNPLEFIDLCTALDIPTHDQTYQEVSSKAHSAKYQGAQTYSHPVIKYVAGKCGGLFIHQTDAAQLRDEFRAVYSKACELFRAGELVESTAPALTQQAIDPNLAYYDSLKRDFAHIPDIAQSYLDDCRAKGIIIDPVARTVIRPDGLRTSGGGM